MESTLTLPIKPLSINAYQRNMKGGKRVKTGKGLAFDEEIEYLLEDHANALQKFGESVDPSNNIIKLIIRVGNPNFYLADRSRVSKTAGDVDNYLKVMQDKLFGCMDIDDHIARHIDVADCHSIEPFTHIILKIVPIPQGFDRQGVPVYSPILDDNRN